MASSVQWEFEADYFTCCNCDWGCPCTFNARPTQGNCNGVGAWRIRRGKFGDTPLGGVTFVGAYFFPGLIEEGNGRARVYVDLAATSDQRAAIEAITSGNHGGGIFEVLGGLVAEFYPLKLARIELRIESPRASLRIEDILEAESEALAYPDGTVIVPRYDLPHGIEYKTALATNAKRWWIRDEQLLGVYEGKYAAVTAVKFTNEGCVG
jgi:hypothetical protein